MRKIFEKLLYNGFKVVVCLLLQNTSLIFYYHFHGIMPFQFVLKQIVIFLLKRQNSHCKNLLAFVIISQFLRGPTRQIILYTPPFLLKYNTLLAKRMQKICWQKNNKSNKDNLGIYYHQLRKADDSGFLDKCKNVKQF